MVAVKPLNIWNWGILWGVAGTDGWLDQPTPRSAGMDFRMGLTSSSGCYSKSLCVPLNQLQMLFRHLWDEAGGGWEQADSSAWLLCVPFQIHSGRTRPWQGILSCPSVVFQCHIRRGFRNSPIFKLPNHFYSPCSCIFPVFCWLLLQKISSRSKAPSQISSSKWKDSLQQSSMRPLQTELSFLF